MPSFPANPAHTRLALALIGALCTGPAGAAGSDVDRYLSLTAKPLIETPKRLQRFASLFSDLDTQKLEQQISDVYAEQFYFNDTLITLDRREALIEYLRATGEKVGSIKTTLIDWAQSGEDVYVRWLLEMEFDVMGKSRFSRTAGMTHLRFDSQGKIILHQDFWDSTGGFYAHVPIIGALIAWVQRRLQP